MKRRMKREGSNARPEVPGKVVTSPGKGPQVGQSLWGAFLVCPVPEVHGPPEPYLARKVWKGRRTGKWALRAQTASRTPAWRSCSATCPTSKRLGSCGHGQSQ